VIVPTGVLHALPWGALPSLRGRPIVVAPSASLWLRLGRRSGRNGRTVLISGPGLRNSGPEVRELSTIFSSPFVLRGEPRPLAQSSTRLTAHRLRTLPATAVSDPTVRSSPHSSWPMGRSWLLTCNVCAAARRDCPLCVRRRALPPIRRRRVARLLRNHARAGNPDDRCERRPVPDAAARRLMRAFYGELANGRGPGSPRGAGTGRIRRLRVSRRRPEIDVFRRRFAALSSDSDRTDAAARGG